MPIKSIWNYVHKGLLAILGVLIVATIISLIFLAHSLSDLDRLITQGGNGIGSVLVLQDILNNLTDMQSSSRGYVVTGDENFLSPYNAALKRLPDDLATLSNTKQDAISKKRISDISSLANKQADYMKQLVNTRMNEGYDAAQALIASKGSENMMNNLREQITTISAAGLQDIGPQQHRASTEMKQALGVGITMGLLVIGACVAVIWYFQRAILKERALESSKNEFLSLASHQLRTPATNVKQYIGLLMDGYMGDLSDVQRKALNVAYKNNEAEIKIMNDLLDVAKLDLHRIQLHKGVANVVSIAQEVVKAHQPVAREKSQILKLTESKSIMANVDKTYLRGVLENLVDNALKYSHPKTKVTVSVSRDQDMICITVKDQGLGIQKRDYHRLFNKFSRLSNEFSANSEGSGLGLYWVKQIVKLHGGYIHVSSREGYGSKFSVYVPVR